MGLLKLVKDCPKTVYTDGKISIKLNEQDRLIIQKYKLIVFAKCIDEKILDTISECLNTLFRQNNDICAFLVNIGDKELVVTYDIKTAFTIKDGGFSCSAKNVSECMSLLGAVSYLRKEDYLLAEYLGESVFS